VLLRKTMSPLFPSPPSKPSKQQRKLTYATCRPPAQAPRGLRQGLCAVHVAGTLPRLLSNRLAAVWQGPLGNPTTSFQGSRGLSPPHLVGKTLASVATGGRSASRHMLLRRHAHTHICTHTHMRTHTYASTHTHTLALYTKMRTHTHNINIHVLTYTHLRSHTHTHTHTKHTHTHARTHTHTHTHAHTHTFCLH